MTHRLNLRRPSNLVLSAAAGGLLLVILLFTTWHSYAGRRVSKITRLGSVEEAINTTTKKNLVDDIYNATLGFEKIFVVGLPTRTDRRDSMVLAAALSGLEIEFIDGIMGPTVPDKAIPQGPDSTRLPEPVIGSWRGHMNAIHEIVKRNLTSALILEDDADWDVRIREQMRDFAYASHALTQPIEDSKKYADPTYPKPRANQLETSLQIPFDSLPSTEPPVVSPYGDNWNALWAGHCGMHFPWSKVAPRARIVQNDETVPQQQFIDGLPDLKSQYPNHTRVYHHVQEGICSLAYAVTQKGARQLLSEAGLKPFNVAYDILLLWFCDGAEQEGRTYHDCLTMQPSLFQHYRPAGPKSAESDISSHGDGYEKSAHTTVVRHSVRLNAEQLMEGETNLIDQYPDVY